MALTHWTFLYAAAGIAEAGDLRIVTTDASTTVLAGFPSAAAALAAISEAPLADELAPTQRVELCGAFGHEHAAALRERRPDVPVGLVTYTGGMTDPLHAIFA
jgi:hypothetical protein